MTEESGDEAPQVFPPNTFREAIEILLIILVVELLLRPWAAFMNEIEPELEQAEAEAWEVGYRLALFWRLITDG